jgi:hypothetical protein
MGPKNYGVKSRASDRAWVLARAVFCLKRDQNSVNGYEWGPKIIYGVKIVRVRSSAGSCSGGLLRKREPKQRK